MFGARSQGHQRRRNVSKPPVPAGPARPRLDCRRSRGRLISLPGLSRGRLCL
jgi:hypothetical protein